jgi:hypothetical protein
MRSPSSIGEKSSFQLDFFIFGHLHFHFSKAVDPAMQLL